MCCNEGNLHLITDEKSIIYINQYVRVFLELNNEECETNFLGLFQEYVTKAKLEKTTQFTCLFNEQKFKFEIKYDRNLYFWTVYFNKQELNLIFYKELIEKNKNIFLLIDSDTGQIVFANQSACDFYQYEYNELIQMKIQDINTMNDEEIKREMKLAKLDERDYFNFKHRLKNQEVIDVQVISKPIEINYGNLLFSIVTPKKFDPEHYMLLKSLFVNSPNAVVLLDSSCRIISVNESFENLFQFRFDELVNRTLDEFIVPEHKLAEFIQNQAGINNGRILRDVTVRQTRNKHLVNVEILAVPLIIDHYTIGFQVYYFDITERMIKEKEQKHILDNLTDFIVKMAIDGTILYVNEAVKKIYPDGHNLVGKNAIQVNEEIHFAPSNWLEALMNPPFSIKGESPYVFNNEIKYIDWKTEAVFNDNGDIEYFILVAHEITEIKKLNEKLMLENITDSLTGLFNRRGLLEQIDNNPHMPEMTALIIHIENLRNIFDYYGHTVGEQLLLQFVNDLKELQIQNCFIGRIYEDEIILMITGLNLRVDIDVIVDSILNLVKKPYTIDKHIDIFISLNFGYSIYPYDTTEHHKLISHADLALIEAKNNPYHNVVRYTPYMSQELENQVVLAKDLKESINKDEIEVYFQPMVNSETKDIQYIEALARWKHHHFGYIPPDTFIKLAEKHNLMIQLDLFLINKALFQFNQLKQNEKYKNCILTINLSPQTLLKNNIALIMHQIINKYQLKPSDICLEISEKTFIHNIETCVNQIQSIRRLGCLIALDDFGREYSSLSILDGMEFDIIKIDKLFIDKIESVKNIEIIKMILTISKISNKVVIAEGVETETQSQKLLTMGCVYQQGYFFAKPIPYTLL